MNIDVLAIAAHPDDTELCCAGTLAALVKQGLKCAVLDLTQGEMGTRGSAKLRLKEAQNAAAIIGLSTRRNLGLPDNRLENTFHNQQLIISAVRDLKPHICLINSKQDRHPDHGHAHTLTSDALFYSGLSKRVTKDHAGDEQQPWRPKHILEYMQDTPFEPDFVFDISETQDIKEKAILAFSSQFNVKSNDDEPSTYISGTNFFELLRNRARIYGHRIGVDYGEPFRYLGGPLPLKDFTGLMSHNPLR
ncbi:MAG: bacillithiol biosynthesis deacetylase BshB1 [Balneolales bacterium]|nr:bacillithiol biosynthesis deacetylase BshB1 [Balneolales bacterium]